MEVPRRRRLWPDPGPKAQQISNGRLRDEVRLDAVCVPETVLATGWRIDSHGKELRYGAQQGTYEFR